MNEELIRRALEIFESRSEVFFKGGCLDLGCAYGNAASILRYAIEGNVECLAQYDDYKDSQE
jgi:hypothetical protein